MKTKITEADHPALEADPRVGTTPEQNRIDFNDPTHDPCPTPAPDSPSESAEA